MQTKKLFYIDPYCKEFEATVLEIRNGNEVILDQTGIYAGTRQKSDKGSINDVSVLRAYRENTRAVPYNGGMIHVGGTIVHVLEYKPDFSHGDTVSGEIDMPDRLATMKLHSASHIIEDRLRQHFPGLQNISAIVTPTEEIYTCVAEGLNEDVLRAIEKETNEFISKNYGISVSEGDEGIRFWNCGPLKERTCGGLHVRSTKEIGHVSLSMSEEPDKQRIFTRLR